MRRCHGFCVCSTRQPSVPGSHRYNSNRIVNALQAIIRILGKSCLQRAPHEINRNQRSSETTTTKNETRQNTVYAVVYTCVSCDLSTESGSRNALSAPRTTRTYLCRVCSGSFIRLLGSIFT